MTKVLSVIDINFKEMADVFKAAGGGGGGGGGRWKIRETKGREGKEEHGRGKMLDLQ